LKNFQVLLLLSQVAMYSSTEHSLQDINFTRVKSQNVTFVSWKLSQKRYPLFFISCGPRMVSVWKGPLECS